MRGRRERVRVALSSSVSSLGSACFAEAVELALRRVVSDRDLALEVPEG